MAGGGTLREEAIADALDFPANQKFTRDFHPSTPLFGDARLSCIKKKHVGE
jgi:hypothetical protein